MKKYYYLAHRIQHPIPKRRFMNFHKFLKKKTNKTCKMYSDWSNKSWKFKFVVSDSVVGSGEQDKDYDVRKKRMIPVSLLLSTTTVFSLICDELLFASPNLILETLRPPGNTSAFKEYLKCIEAMLCGKFLIKKQDSIVKQNSLE